MTQHRSPLPLRDRSRTALPGVALALTSLLVLGACGGDTDVPTSSPTALGSQAGADAGDDAGSTSAAAPTGDQTGDGAEEPSDDSAQDQEGEESDTWATFTEEPAPLSPDEGAFADDPRVQAVTLFNEELARAATDNDPERAQWLETLNEDSLTTLQDTFAEEFGRTYPGPLPFRVLDVADLEDGTGSVQGCMITDGFSVGAPGEGEGMTGLVVSSIEYSLVEDPADEGTWLVDAIYAGAYDCSTTDVEARSW